MQIISAMLAFFETGKIYHNALEREALTILLSGRRFDNWRDSYKKDSNFYDLKGAIVATLNAVGITDGIFEPCEDSIFLLRQIL